MSEVKRYFWNADNLDGFGYGSMDSMADASSKVLVCAPDYDTALAREAALREELERFKRDAEQDTTIDERDRYHEMADSLALAIYQHFRVEIGEHSSMNCPWSAALEVMNGAYITDTNEGRERDALQQRLTEAERYVQKMIDCSQGQDSIATGYLADILAKLKRVEASESQAHTCDGCGAQGWTANCDKCIPY